MKRALKKNSALYLLALANLVYAVKNGFNWLTYLALALALISLVLEVLYGKNSQ